MRRRVLLLCDDSPQHANTVLDHINAFRRFSAHEVKTFNPRGIRNAVTLDLDAFDVVVVHYSLVLISDSYVAPAFRNKLRRYRGLKVQFIQDEYRWVDRTTAAMRDAGIDILFTCAPEPAAGQLYDERLPGVKRVLTLTGYVPMNLEGRPRRPIAERRLDVVYRGRDLPYWLGRLTQEKTWIAQGFGERAPQYGLRIDIGWREGERIYGERWNEFIASSRTTLGTESGASIADFDGSVEAGVKAYLARHPGAPYGEVLEAVLRPYEGNVVVNVISPRVFEAAALGTALVMFPGTYSGIVEEGRHYIPLEKDFSNMDEVAARIKDVAALQAMSDRTYDDLVGSGRWSYESFIKEFDAVVSEHAPSRRHRAGVPHELARIEQLARQDRPILRRARARAGVVRKRAFAAVTVLRERPLRAIYLAGSRMGLSQRGLLEELVTLYLLRRAVQGRLSAREPFALAWTYDTASRALEVSSHAPASAAEDGARTAQARATLMSRDVAALRWNHSGIGNAISLRRPRVTLAVGDAGCEDFPLIARVAKSKPELLSDALAPLLEGVRTSAESLV